MSASINPTRWPARAIAAARFAETVDFPTPPLPLEIASTLPRPGSSSGVGGGGGGGGGAGAVDLGRRDASHGFDGFASLARERRGIVSCQDKRETDGAGLIGGDISHHVRRQHVATIPGIANAAQRLLDACLEIRRTHDWAPPPPVVRNR